MSPDARLLHLCRRSHRPPLQHKNFSIIAQLTTNSIAFIHAQCRRYRVTKSSYSHNIIWLQIESPCRLNTSPKFCHPRTPTPSFGYGSSPSESQNPRTPTPSFGYGSSPSESQNP